jgi:acyl transferase domain-containing protein
MASPIIFMFAGQGSQYFQMGRELYEAGGVFSRCLRYLDTFMLDTFGKSVLATLYGNQNKSAPFADTTLSHPAIFMVEVALAQELIDRGIYPEMTMAVSMGSFAAAAVAGHLRVERALELVVRQAHSLVSHCDQGGMFAVLGKPHLHEAGSLRQHSVIAAYNCDSHFVLSAKAQHMSGIAETLRAQGTTFQSLPVAFAYHSPWIEAARDMFENAARQTEFKPVGIPLVCCAQSNTLFNLPTGFLWDAIRQPIQFQSTITRLEAGGAFRYLDLGATGTLATFLKYLLPANTRSTFGSVITPYGRNLESLSALVTAINAGQNYGPAERRQKHEIIRLG